MKSIMALLISGPPDCNIQNKTKTMTQQQQEEGAKQEDEEEEQGEEEQEICTTDSGRRSFLHGMQKCVTTFT